MTTSKLHAWRDVELATLAGMLGGAWAQWRRAWGLRVGEEPSVTCAPTPALDRAAWDALDGNGTSGAWIAWSPGAHDDLLSLLGRGSADFPMGQEAAVACKQDALGRLAAVLRLQSGSRSQPVPCLPAGKWSGSVGASFACGSVLLMDAACVQRALQEAHELCRPRRTALPALVGLPEAASRCITRVDARLLDCELDVAVLQRLRVGDVIRVPHGLTRPLAIHDAAGDAIFDGFLARSGGFKAVELTAATTT